LLYPNLWVQEKTELAKKNDTSLEEEVKLSLYRAGHTVIVTGVRGSKNF